MDRDHILPVGHCCEHKYKVDLDTDTVDEAEYEPLVKEVFEQPINEQPADRVVNEPICFEDNRSMNQNGRKRMSKKKNDQFCRDKRRKMKKTNMKRLKLSGCLHWAGCDLIVDSPLNGVIDIHGAGEFTALSPHDDYGHQKILGKVDGIPHCVIGRETAIRLEDNNVVAKPFYSIKTLTGIKYFIQTVEVVDPFNPILPKISVSSCALCHPDLSIWLLF